MKFMSRENLTFIKYYLFMLHQTTRIKKKDSKIKCYVLFKMARKGSNHCNGDYCIWLTGAQNILIFMYSMELCRQYIS